MEPLRLTMPSAGGEVKVSPEPGRAFALAFSPVGMRFERGGSNLYIDAADGGHIVITEYFAQPELPSFYTEDGKFVSGADFLMVMNPVMDLTVAGSFFMPRGTRSSIFTPLEKPWEEGVFYSLASGDEIPDYGYHPEWGDAAAGAPAPGFGPGPAAPDAIHYWMGKDACQGQAYIQELEGSLTVTVTAAPGAAVKAFLTYVALNGEDAPASECCQFDNTCGTSLFQDGPMGRASTTLNREADCDKLVLAAESFYSFQAYYGGWLSMSFPAMQARGVDILLNAPSGQAVVDLEEYFGSSIFHGTPVSWSYEEGQEISGKLAEFVDEGFDLVELIDALKPEQEALPDLHMAYDGQHSGHETLPPRVENIVLVRADTNDVVNLADEWTHAEATDTSYRTFTLDEQSLLLQGNGPSATRTEEETTES